MNFDFSKRRSARISSLTSDSESRTTNYGRKLQQNAPEKYQEYKEKEKKRKRKEYIPVRLQSGQNKDEIRHKWAAANRAQRIRKKQSKSEENPSKRPRIDEERVSYNLLKRFKDLNEVERREYFRLKMASKREHRCHQKYQQREQWILEERIRRNHLLLNCHVHHHCQHHKQVLKTNVDHHCQHQQQAGLQHQQQAGLHTSGSSRK